VIKHYPEFRKIFTLSDQTLYRVQNRQNRQLQYFVFFIKIMDDAKKTGRKWRSRDVKIFAVAII